MNDSAVDYVKVLKKNGYHAQTFIYDKEQYLHNIDKRKTLELNFQNKLCRIHSLCKMHFQDLLKGLIHLKVMRVFMEGVLRFGIPPKFFICMVKPDKGREKKIWEGFTKEFAEEHLKDMYGEKQDAQDEDFFPYISSEIKVPMML